VAVGREQILALAHVAVNSRGRQYGEPEENFGRLAAVWTARTADRLDVEFDAHWVAIFLASLKLVRLAEDPSHQDSWVDLAGYAACGGEIAINHENKENKNADGSQ
jgi:hypothetical protein